MSSVHLWTKQQEPHCVRVNAEGGKSKRGEHFFSLVFHSVLYAALLCQSGRREVCIENSFVMQLSGEEFIVRSQPATLNYTFKWVIKYQLNIKTWTETLGAARSPVLSCLPSYSICQQQTNTDCVLFLCDTWAAVGGPCDVFIHRLVSSQTGTEFHYSGIKRNQFCPPRARSLWVWVQRMLTL